MENKLVVAEPVIPSYEELNGVRQPDAVYTEKLIDEEPDNATFFAGLKGIHSKMADNKATEKMVLKAREDFMKGLIVEPPPELEDMGSYERDDDDDEDYVPTPVVVKKKRGRPPTKILSRLLAKLTAIPEDKDFTNTQNIPKLIGLLDMTTTDLMDAMASCEQKLKLNPKVNTPSYYKAEPNLINIDDSNTLQDRIDEGKKVILDSCERIKHIQQQLDNEKKQLNHHRRELLETKTRLTDVMKAVDFGPIERLQNEILQVIVDRKTR